MKISMEVGVIAPMRCHKMINGSKLLIFSSRSWDFGIEDFFRASPIWDPMGPWALGPWDRASWDPRDSGTLGHWDPGTLGPGLLGPQGPWDRASWDPRDTGTLGPWDRASWDPGPQGAPGAPKAEPIQWHIDGGQIDGTGLVQLYTIDHFLPARWGLNSNFDTDFDRST